MVIPVLGTGRRGSTCNAWLVAGLLVDPSGDPWERRQEFWRAFCREHAVRALALTHWHADHSTGVADLALETGLPLFAPPCKRERVFSSVMEGDRILERFTVVATPGHDIEHVSFWDADERLMAGGDALDPNVFGRVSESTIEKIAALSLRTFLPGHGHPEEMRCP